MMRNKWFLRVALLLPILYATPLRARANALEQTQALLKAFKAVKAIPDDGSALSAADKKANNAAFVKLDGFFDYGNMASASIEPHITKFSSAQRAAFRETFRELIRLVAYPGSSVFMKKAKTSLKAGKRIGPGVEILMDAELVEEDLETTVTFYWRPTKSGWKINDVRFDGASLTKDYRNQFGRIIAKNGIDGLLDKLKKRLEQERKSGVL